MADNVNAAGSGSVRSVERAINLLFSLAEHPDGASLNQLARDIQCSKSTVHRLLATLEGLDVAEQDARSREYRLAPRVRRLGRDGWTRVDLREIAASYMRELRDLSGETVTLHAMEGTSYVVIDQCESQQAVRRVWDIGQRLPLLGGATTRAILSVLGLEEAERILAQTRTAERGGPARQELETARRQGYAFAYSERVPGGSSISAPLFGASGRVVGAISVSGPDYRFTEERAVVCAPSLIQAATRISSAMGAPHRMPRT